MNTKFWMSELKKDEVPVRLFTETTDKMVEVDLGIPASGSLISLGRDSLGVVSDSSNHYHLAVGAISSHLRYSGKYAEGRSEVSEVESIPEAEEINIVGGVDGTFLCRIWEQPVDPE